MSSPLFEALVLVRLDNITRSYTNTSDLLSTYLLGLSRVTTFVGIYLTEPCEDKIAVHPDVKIEMERLRTVANLSFVYHHFIT